MERTTNLDKLRKGAPFTWGKVITIHEIGEYAIVEFYSGLFKDSCRVPGKYENTSSFHGYVHEKDMSESFQSMDEALAGCIAYKHEGCSHWADSYFMKMIKAN